MGIWIHTHTHSLRSAERIVVSRACVKARGSGSGGEGEKGGMKGGGERPEKEWLRGRKEGKKEEKDLRVEKGKR